MRVSLKVVAIVLTALSGVSCQQIQSPAAPSSLGLPSALQFASIGGSPAVVVAFQGQSGSASFDLVVSIPLSIDTAARAGNAPFGIRTTITYVSVNNTVETFVYGPVAIPNTILLSSEGGRAFIQISANFGSSPLPGANPSFSATAEVVTM